MNRGSTLVLSCVSLLQLHARWLFDLEEFNEWMNEEDYLMGDDTAVSL